MAIMILAQDFSDHSVFLLGFSLSACEVIVVSGDILLLAQRKTIKASRSTCSLLSCSWQLTIHFYTYIGAPQYVYKLVVLNI
jgi:hypothetical protein